MSELMRHTAHVIPSSHRPKQNAAEHRSSHCVRLRLGSDEED